MKLAILKERRAGEARVAATPDAVKRLKGLGLDVVLDAHPASFPAEPSQARVRPARSAWSPALVSASSNDCFASTQFCDVFAGSETPIVSPLASCWPCTLVAYSLTWSTRCLGA